MERLGTLVQITNRSWSEINGLTTTVNYYCRVIPGCQDSCCTGEGGLPVPKRSTHHCQSHVPGSCSKLEKLIQQELKYLGLICLQHQAPLSKHALKKHPLQIKLGSGLYNGRHLSVCCGILAITTCSWDAQYRKKKNGHKKGWLKCYLERIIGLSLV